MLWLRPSNRRIAACSSIGMPRWHWRSTAPIWRSSRRRRILFLHNGRAPRVPEVDERPFLPMKAKRNETLEKLAVDGPRDFYEVEIAELLVAGLASGGSVLSRKDFAGYAPRWLDPLTSGL